MQGILNLFLMAFLLICLLIFYQYVTDKYGIGEKTAERNKVREQEKIIVMIKDNFYAKYAAVICECVSEIYYKVGLVKPNNIALNMAVDSTRWHQYHRLCFILYFDRSVTMGGGKKIEYSTIPAEDIVKILNSHIPSFCVKMGLPAAYALVGVSAVDGRVSIMFTVNEDELL